MNQIEKNVTNPGHGNSVSYANEHAALWFRSLLNRGHSVDVLREQLLTEALTMHCQYNGGLRELLLTTAEAGSFRARIAVAAIDANAIARIATDLDGVGVVMGKGESFDKSVIPFFKATCNPRLGVPPTAGDMTEGFLEGTRRFTAEDTYPVQRFFELAQENKSLFVTKVGSYRATIALAAAQAADLHDERYPV